MSWQDIVLAIGGIVGVVALFPSIMSEDKPAVTTSVLNSALAIAIATVDLSLHLLYAATIASVIAVLWAVLAVQQWNRHHRSRKSG